MPNDNDDVFKKYAKQGEQLLAPQEQGQTSPIYFLGSTADTPEQAKQRARIKLEPIPSHK